MILSVLGLNMYKRDVWGVISVVPVLYIDVFNCFMQDGIYNAQDVSMFRVYNMSLCCMGNVYLSIFACITKEWKNLKYFLCEKYT